MAKVGGPRVFFDVVGTFNAARLITDSRAQMAVVESIVLDSMDAVVQSFAGIGESVTQLTSKVVPMGVALSEATIEFEKFAGENERLADGIIKTGMAFGFTAEQSLAAGAKMAQLTAVIGEAAVQTATELGQTFALISGMGTEEAMTRMINLQQQTGFMYGDLTKAQFEYLDAQDQQNTVYANTIEVLDQLNTIENRSASTMKQLTFVMNQFASQANRTGESISHMAAMSAVLIESGEEQGKAGRALRMIYARLGSNIQNNNDLLHQQGIETKTATGEMRPLSDIVTELAAKFPDLTAEQQQLIVQTVAGNDHYVRFVKLIDNAARMQELATDATTNQSTATEELNRVIEDNSTKYKEAQAQLQHYQAEVGQALLPAMTEATLMQARFNKGIASFGDSAIFSKLAQFVLQLQVFGQVAGGVIDTYMNMKSVNIAMMTHQTVLRAINGEEIIRTDLYRKQGLFSGITLSNQKDYARIAVMAVQSELMATEHIEQQANLVMMIKQEKEGVYNNEQRLRAIFQEQNVIKQDQLASEMKMIEVVQQRNGYANYELNAAKALAATKMRLTAKEYSILQTSVTQRRILLNTEEMEVRLHEKNLALAQITQRDNQSAIDAALQRNQIERENTQARTAAAALRRRELDEERQLLYTLDEQQRVANEANVQGIRDMLGLHEAKSIALQDEIGLEEALLREHNEAIIMAQTEAQAQQRLNDLDDETVMIMQQLGVARERIVLLTEEEIHQAKVLMFAKEEMNEADRVALEQKLAIAIQERNTIDGLNQSENAVNRMSAQMGKLSMAAGMAAMGVGLLSNVLGLDEDESMRVQLILMSMSMIPAIVQMSAMSASMMTTSASAAAAAGGTAGFSFSLAGLTVAARSAAASVSALVVAAAPIAGLAMLVGVVAYGFSKMISNANDGAEDFAELNTELKITLELLNTLTELEASAVDTPVELANQLGATFDLTTASLNALMDASEQSEAVLADMREKQSNYADDDPFFKMYQERINAIVSFNGLVEQQAAVLAGDELAHTFGTARLAKMVDLIANDMIDSPEIEGRIGNYLGQQEIMQYRHNQTGASWYEGTGEYEDVNVNVHDMKEVNRLLKDGTMKISDLDEQTKEALYNAADAYVFAANSFGFIVDDVVEGGGAMGDGFSTAEEKMRSFANAREELFFGGKSQYMSGDMMKQVVNKGVENLYQNVELLMTNNFFGLTIDEAIDKVTDGVTRQLIEQGVPLRS